MYYFRQVLFFFAIGKSYLQITKRCSIMFAGLLKYIFICKSARLSTTQTQTNTVIWDHEKCADCYEHNKQIKRDDRGVPRSRKSFREQKGFLRKRNKKGAV